MADTSAPNYAEWLTLDQVAARTGVATATAWGWVKKGVKTEAGVVYLDGAKIGGVWRVDPAAIEPFVRATTRAALPAAPKATRRERAGTSPQDLRRQAEEAMRWFEAHRRRK